MKPVVLVVLFVALVSGKLVLPQSVKDALDRSASFFSLAKKTTMMIGAPQDMDLECALCGIAVNEVYGFVAENLTEAQIQVLLQNDVCKKLPLALSLVCDEIVAQLPAIIARFENRDDVSRTCIDFGMCSRPFQGHPDLSPVPTFTIDLDKAPEDRWTEVCSHKQYVSVVQFMIGVLRRVLGEAAAADMAKLGEDINTMYMPQEYAAEIRGCAQHMNVPAGWMSLLNMGYELSDACTSIVAATDDNKIYHARNLDFWAGMGFTDSLKNLTFEGVFTRGGKEMFRTASFAGYVGVLSAFKNNKFSLTLDTRFYPGGVVQLFEEVVVALTEKNASLVSFLARDVLQNENDWQAAVNQLSNGKLIADIYFIVAGIGKNEGAVISRNRINATDVWLLDADNGRWFLTETNYDHWKKPFVLDDRRVPANNAMKAMGRKHLSLDGMLKVLSIKPVLNLQSTYSTLSCPADGTWKVMTRWCDYPCVE